MILQLFMSGSEVFYRPCEFSAFRWVLSSERIQEDTEAILNCWDTLLRWAEKTTKSSLKLSKTQQKSACVVMISVWLRLSSSLMKSVWLSRVWTASRKRVFGSASPNSAKGRFCICLYRRDTKSETDTTLSSDIRCQFATKILLPLRMVKRMAFDGEVATKGGVERFKGFYISDGKTDETPLSLLWLILHTHHLNDLKCFERAYKCGFSVRWA